MLCSLYPLTNEVKTYCIDYVIEKITTTTITTTTTTTLRGIKILLCGRGWKIFSTQSKEITILKQRTN